MRPLDPRAIVKGKAEEEVALLYRDGLSVTQISEKTGIHRSSIWRSLLRSGIKTRRVSKKHGRTGRLATWATLEEAARLQASYVPEDAADYDKVAKAAKEFHFTHDLVRQVMSQQRPYNALRQTPEARKEKLTEALDFVVQGRSVEAAVILRNILEGVYGAE